MAGEAELMDLQWSEIHRESTSGVSAVVDNVHKTEGRFESGSQCVACARSTKSRVKSTAKYSELFLHRNWSCDRKKERNA